MRKLNKKNKIYIIILSIFATLVFAAILIFAFYKLKELNIKYFIDNNSITFNMDKELINIENNAYVKKDFLSRYVLYQNDKKINLGATTVIYNENISKLQMFGTFYEILKDGEINKIKGESDISTNEKNRVFKISDRRYLVVGPNIKSTENGLLSTKGFLLIDLDKVGNAFLYNKELNIKTFKDLYLVNNDFSFKVNEEILTINNEEINLANVNGSSNEYAKKKKSINSESGNGSGGGNGSGEGLFPGNKKEEPKIEQIIEEKYISRKTSVINTSSTAETITINYIVYDPFAEYTGLSVVLYENNNKVGTYELDLNQTSYTIENLNASSYYKLYFYYSYLDNEEVQSVLFDTLDVETKSIKAKLGLEMIDENSVRYILRVEGNYKLDSATVTLNISTSEGDLVYNHHLSENDLIKAASEDGFVDTFDSVSLNGTFATISLKNCVYNGKSIDTQAYYKIKL